MSDEPAQGGQKRRRGPVKLAELVGRVIDPVTQRRGYATTGLIAAWHEVAGDRIAACSRPEKIVWPKGEANEASPALLVLRVDGPRAIFVQHEAGQIIERVNAYLGYAAIGRIRIVQGAIAGSAAAPGRPPPPPPLPAADAQKLRASLEGVADEGLRSALERLGLGVLTDKTRGNDR